jgi:hypothetical protein
VKNSSIFPRSHDFAGAGFTDFDYNTKKTGKKFLPEVIPAQMALLISYKG